MDLDSQVMEREEHYTGNLSVFGHSFNMIMAYNTRVSKLVTESISNAEGYLGDPNLELAVEYVHSDTKVFGVTYNKARYQFRKGNHPTNYRLMNDGAKQGYFMNLVRWVKDTFEQETKEEMNRKKVPQASVNLKLVKPYTRNSQIF